MTDFADLVPKARAFLADLAAHNDRDWFQAHKPAYEAALKRPAEALLAEMTPRLADLTGRPMETKLFRINRDVRFSKDKAPYNTHLHMLWREAGRADGPGWFFGVSLDYVRAGWGWMGWTPDQLATWRAAVDGPYGDGIAAALAAAGMELGEPELKRIPAPHAKDHPLGPLLRRKSLVLWDDPPDARPATLMAVFERAEPVRAELDSLL